MCTVFERASRRALRTRPPFSKASPSCAHMCIRVSTQVGWLSKAESYAPGGARYALSVHDAVSGAVLLAERDVTSAAHAATVAFPAADGARVRLPLRSHQRWGDRP